MMMMMMMIMGAHRCHVPLHNSWLRMQLDEKPQQEQHQQHPSAACRIAPSPNAKAAGGEEEGGYGRVI